MVEWQWMIVCCRQGVVLSSGSAASSASWHAFGQRPAFVPMHLDRTSVLHDKGILLALEALACIWTWNNCSYYVMIQ
jgi:hypothetical protein